MKHHGNKLLLGFLGFGLLVYWVSMGYREDPSETGLRADTLNMDMDTSSVRTSVDTQAALHRRISLESYSLKAEDSKNWKLPRRLAEISGLAMTLDNRLLVHTDEKGVIYEIDYRNGIIVKAFQLTDIAAPVAGDFEGIATVDNQVYLVTSSGRLYECSEGAAPEITYSKNRDCVSPIFFLTGACP